MKLKVLTYNTLFAGRDGADERRAQAQIRLINEFKPDVFLIQEAKGFDADGSKELYELEASIGMRGFLASAPNTGQHVAIFIREPLQVLSFHADSIHFHHATAILKVALPNVDRPITFFSTHLCPNGSAVRRREAAYLAVQADSDSFKLLAGDFNSVSPHDPEPEGFSDLAKHFRVRYLADDLQHADRTVLSCLETGGWIDLGHVLEKQFAATVPTERYQHSEFAKMRCDYVMASRALADKARSYQVIRNEITDMASDHYPVLVTLEMDA